MKEADFIKLYKKRSGDKDKKIVKEKIDRFWEMLFKALEEEKKVKFKDWGVFEIREMKGRKIIVPVSTEAIYTEPKKTIKFRAGKGLLDLINNESGDDNE